MKLSGIGNLSKPLTLLMVTALVSAAAARKNLQDILDMAVKKSDDLHIIEQSHEAGIRQIQSFKASVYPQIYFSTGATYFSNSIKGLGVFGSILGGGGQDTAGGAGAAPPPDPIDRFKGMEYSMAAVLEQPIFTFGRLGIVRKMAKEQTKLLGRQKKLSREAFLVNVVIAYNMAVIARVEADIAEKSHEAAKKFHDLLEIDYKAGARPKIEWLQAKAGLAQSSAELNTSRSTSEVMLNNLKNLIGLNEEDDLELDSGENMYPRYMLSVPASASDQMPKATSLQEMHLSLAYDLSKYEKARLYPSISLNGQVANQLTMITDPEEWEGDTRIRDLIDHEYFNYRIGLTLNWTVFDGFRTTSTYKRAWALAKIEERNLAKMKKRDKVNLSEAEKLVVSSAEGIKAAEAARDAGAMAFEQAKIDLEAGALSVTQYTDIEKQYKETQLLYYQAKARELMAHINLKMTRGEDVFKK